MLEGSLGCPNYFERNFPKAIELWNKAARLESRGTSTHGWLGWGYEADKQYEKALDDNEAYEKAVDGNVAQIEAKYRKYRLVLARKGPREMWQAMLDEMRQSPSPDHYDIARLCARLGYTDEALRFLDKAYAAHNGHMTFLLFDDCWDTLRHDPRFNELLERMGFSVVTPPRK